MRRVLVIAAVAAFAAMPAVPALSQADATVLVTRVEGPITPVVANHLADTVDRAAEEGHDAVLVGLDTPGGLGTAMRDIVKTFLGAPVPVIVYVTPAGASAASAGAIITLAAHVAAMAPGTNIGAATPVSLGGEMPEEVGDKIVNDAAAYAEAIAEFRGRDTTVAREMVTEGRSDAAPQALEAGVIDFVASSVGEVLQEADGRRVRIAGGETVVVDTAGASLVEHDMAFFARVRQWLADPNIAFMFMSIGSLAIIYELANPGMGFGGIVGVILIVLALFSLAVLPVNAVGVLLLLLAAGLLVAELFVPGVGVFAAGGTVSLVLAGLFLFEGTFGVDLAVLIPIAAVVFLMTIVAGRLVWRARRAPSATGAGQLTGRTTVLRDAYGNRGRVQIDGTWWDVRTDDGSLETGKVVRVSRMEGLRLIVEPVEEAEE